MTRGRLLNIKPKELRVKAGDSVDLKAWPTVVDPVYKSKEDYVRILEEHVARLSELQDKLYAVNQYALLVIFQAMDAAGKDGAIKHVMSGINPQGCQVFAFGPPSAEELDHDFLWRSVKALPERGRIGIFNRSYYEEVLVARVHGEILARQDIPDLPADRHRLWEDRYRSILDFEAHQHRNGLRIVKIFLHVSKEEQRKRLLERIDDPRKNWKFQAGDIAEREHWKEYRSAYEKCIAATSTKASPWYVVPADDKLSARLIVSRILLESLDDLDMSFPEATPQAKTMLESMRKHLTG